MPVHIERSGGVMTILIDRPERRNAVDGPTSRKLAQAFRAFEAEEGARVAVLGGTGGTFCAGADLKAIAEGTEANPLDPSGDGPMGPSRMLTTKPVVAAIDGHAVAGGLELALWCDLRVAEETAVLGCFERRFGVPLIDGGTVRLPRLIGMSRALDLILTGRAVTATEAHAIGLVNRVVPPGQARAAAEALAHELSQLPRVCMNNDRRSVYEQSGLPLEQALAREFELGLKTLAQGEGRDGAIHFAGGAGRHGGGREKTEGRE